MCIRDSCYATQNRQDAVKKMVNQCDLVIVVGSPNSSNSNRLCEVARNANVESYMVDPVSYTHLDVYKRQGVPVKKIAAAIRKFKPAAGRMQLKKGYFQVIDDGDDAADL